MIRIQLASNFQVVELTYDEFGLILDDEVEKAIDLVNRLGKEVVNDIKTKTPGKPAVEMATPKQIDCLVKYLDYTRAEARKLTKKEAYELMHASIEAAKNNSDI